MTFPRLVVVLAAFGALISTMPAHAKARHHVVRHHRVASVWTSKLVRHRHPLRRRTHVAKLTPVAAPVERQDDSNSAYWNNDRSGRAGPVEHGAYAAGNDLVAIARQFLGRGNVTGYRGQWCGAFLGLVAKRAGHAVPAGYLKASEWIHAGRRLSGPRPGAVAVWSHHVGIVEAITARGPLLISGNFGRRVAEGYQRRGRLLGYIEL